MESEEIVIKFYREPLRALIYLTKVDLTPKLQKNVHIIFFCLEYVSDDLEWKEMQLFPPKKEMGLGIFFEKLFFVLDCGPKINLYLTALPSSGDLIFPLARGCKTGEIMYQSSEHMH